MDWKNSGRAGANVGGTVAAGLWEDIPASSATVATFGTDSTNRYDTPILVTIAIAVVPLIYGDGTNITGGALTCATGTNGLAMPYVNVGDLLHVLYMSKPTDNTGHFQTITDSLGNSFVAAGSGHYEASSNRQFLQAYSIVTNPGTPVVTGTYGSSNVSAQAIACAVLQGINKLNPFTTGSSQNNQQVIGASPAANSQTSTAPGSPLTYLPETLCGWGYCDGLTGAPTVGTSPVAFTDYGSMWGGLSGIACLRYETAIVSTPGPFAATFNPVASQTAYTFVLAFNQIVNTGKLMWMY